MKNLGLFALFSLTINVLCAQKHSEHPLHLPGETANNQGSLILVNLTVGGHTPGGDMAKRFGWDNAFGGGVDYTTKDNWTFGLDFQYFFGEDVQEDVLAPVRVDSGYVVGLSQNIVDVLLRERGWMLGGHVGKLFPFSKNSRNGLRVTLGAATMQHWIRVLDNTNTSPYFADPYLAGFDRLSGGLALRQFVGYQVLGKSRRINFFIGFDFTEAFTHTLRDFDFAAQKKLDSPRVDLLWGVRAGWSLPFYFNKAETIYY